MIKYLFMLIVIISCGDKKDDATKFIDDGLSENFIVSTLTENHNKSDLTIRYDDYGKVAQIGESKTNYTLSSKGDRVLHERRMFDVNQLLLVQQLDIDANSTKLYQRIAMFDNKVAKLASEYKIFKDCSGVSVKLGNERDVRFSTSTKDKYFSINGFTKDLANKKIQLKKDAKVIFEVTYEKATNVTDATDVDNKLFWIKSTARMVDGSDILIAVYYKAFLKTDEADWANLVAGDSATKPEYTIVLYDDALGTGKVKAEKHLRIVKKSNGQEVWDAKHLVYKYEDQNMDEHYKVDGETADILGYLLKFTIIDEVIALLAN